MEEENFLIWIQEIYILLALPSDFQVTTPKNHYSRMKQLHVQWILPLPWTIPKYQPTVEPSLQSPIKLDLVETSSLLHRC